MLVLLLGDHGVGRKTLIERLEGSQCLEEDSCSILNAQDEVTHQLRAPCVIDEESLGDVAHILFMYDTQRRETLDHITNWSSQFLGVAGTPPTVHTSVSIIGTHIDQGDPFENHDELVSSITSIMAVHYKSVETGKMSTRHDTPASLRAVLPSPPKYTGAGPSFQAKSWCAICT